MNRLVTRLVGIWARLGHHEVGILGSVLALGAGLWVFFRLADEVMEGDTHAFDQAVLLALRTPGRLDDPLGPFWLELTARDVTSLGGYPVLILMTLAAIGFLLIARKPAAALLVLASVGGGMLLSSALKYVFDRTRPDLVPHGVEVYTTSFPSGHAMLSAVTYLTLGALLATGSAAARRQGLPAGGGHRAGSPDRRQPRLSRCALANRRACRLVRRRRLGDAVLDRGGLAATPRPGRERRAIGRTTARSRGESVRRGR